jgi:uncharacterized protein (TIGR03435 family)
VRIAIATLFGLAAIAYAQAPAQFEVASLKPGLPVGDRFNINLGSVSHGTLTLTNASLSDCLHFAYSLSNNEQLAGPAWITDKTVRFDIVAKAPATATNAEIRVMLRNLLTARFQMQFHREPRTLNYMALTVAGKGALPHEASADADTSGNSTVMGRIVSARLPMITLVTLLSRFLREPVVDSTGLTGLYEVKLEWTPDPPLTADPNAGGASDFPAIRKAIEEQLGLRLTPRKGPLDVLVIDHVEKVPIGN